MRILLVVCHCSFLQRASSLSRSAFPIRRVHHLPPSQKKPIGQNSAAHRAYTTSDSSAIRIFKPQGVRQWVPEILARQFRKFLARPALDGKISSRIGQRTGRRGQFVEVIVDGNPEVTCRWEWSGRMDLNHRPPGPEPCI